MKKFEFSEDEYNYICKKAMLNEELQLILKMKIQDNSIVEIADKIHRSERTVNRRVKTLKRLIKKVL